MESVFGSKGGGSSSSDKPVDHHLNWPDFSVIGSIHGDTSYWPITVFILVNGRHFCNGNRVNLP